MTEPEPWASPLWLLTWSIVEGPCAYALTAINTVDCGGALETCEPAVYHAGRQVGWWAAFRAVAGRGVGVVGGGGRGGGRGCHRRRCPPTRGPASRRRRGRPARGPGRRPGARRRRPRPSLAVERIRVWLDPLVERRHPPPALAGASSTPSPPPPAPRPTSAAADPIGPSEPHPALAEIDDLVAALLD